MKNIYLIVNLLKMKIRNKGFLEKNQFTVIDKNIFTFEEFYNVLILNNDIVLEPFNM